MEMDTNSVLQMLDLFFSSISFKQKKEKTGELKLSINHSIDRQKNNNDDSLFRVIITTTIEDDQKQLQLKVETVGIFKIMDTTLDDETKQTLISLNTVAIMFPYIRSEIAILTAQPGIVPIQIPIVDVNKLVRD